MTMRCGSLNCGQQRETMEQLRTHWAEAHIDDLRPVDESLRTVDTKLAQIEGVAAEGMIGHRDVPYVPIRFPVYDNFNLELERTTTIKWLVNKKRREVRI